MIVWRRNVSNLKRAYVSGQLSKQSLESVTDVIFIDINLEVMKWSILDFLSQNISFHL